MKTLSIAALCTFCSLQMLSQDTLYTKTGQVINGKVTEINSSEIKYKKASNPDGPTYILDKSEIVLIHYKNGSKDVFQSGDPSSIADTDNGSGVNQGPGQGNSPTVVNNNYTSYPAPYVYGRPGVNVVVGGYPFFGFRPWGWSWGGYYRGGYYRGGYGHHYYYGPRGGYYHGGHHGGHHR